MTDYAVKVTVRNGRILSKMKERGIKSQAELARLSGQPLAQVNSLVTMRKPAKLPNGDWPDSVYAISSALWCEPEDLFTELQQERSLPKNNKEIFVTEDAAKQLFSGNDIEQTAIVKNTVEHLLSHTSLTDREIYIVKAITCDGRTLRDLGEEFNLSGQRILSINAKAMRKLKWKANELGLKTNHRKFTNAYGQDWHGPSIAFYNA